MKSQASSVHVRDENRRNKQHCACTERKKCVVLWPQATYHVDNVDKRHGSQIKTIGKNSKGDVHDNQKGATIRQCRPGYPPNE